MGILILDNDIMKSASTTCPLLVCQALVTMACTETKEESLSCVD